ncbi:MAG: hypothetical protein ABL962_09785 [Fimbriimonadaceae bacterium]
MTKQVCGMLDETVGMMFALAGAGGYVPADDSWETFTFQETRGHGFTDNGPFWWQVVPAYISELRDPELSTIIDIAELWFGAAPPQFPPNHLLTECIHFAQANPLYAEWRAFIANRPKGAALEWTKISENERQGYIYRFWFE